MSTPREPLTYNELITYNMDDLLVPHEVADVFRVDPKTVTRYAKSGRLKVGAITPGGHRRYRVRDVLHTMGVLPEEKE